MLFSRANLALFLSAAVLAAPVFAATTTTIHKKSSTSTASTHSKAHTSKTSSKAHTSKTSSKSHKGSKSHPKSRGQQGIDSARATEIQQALIRDHYLTGDPTGKWDSSTIAAMQKFQADQGWQTKLTPDSRALKKLGLGADYSNAVNASGSSFAEPKPTSDIPGTQAAGFAAASGVNQ